GKEPTTCFASPEHTYFRFERRLRPPGKARTPEMAQNSRTAPGARDIATERLPSAPLSPEMQGGALLAGDPYYIRATSPPADEHTRVLKQGETFAIFDHFGDVKPVGMQEEGIYHEGTRFLSCLVLRLGPDRPLILSSNVKRDNALLTVDLTNPDIAVDGSVIPRGTVHLFRCKFLW